MPKRQSLPLSALRAFEAAARHQSYSAAAEELCVTHGAISQQVKRLEDQTGLSVFQRHNRGVRLTPAGAALFPVLNDCFDRMSETLDALTPEPEPGRLRVTTTPYFASRWLIPRLDGWRRHSETSNVDLHPSLHMVDIAGGDCDVGIRCGAPPWPGLRSELLLPIHLSPVCSPALLEGRQGIKEPRDLYRHDLIHADIATHERGEEWNTWLTAAGENPLGNQTGLHFQEPALALQAAADGLGVAMGYLEFVEADLKSGRLVKPFELSVRHDFSYYLVYPDRQASRQKIQAFAAWALAEAQGKALKA